MTIRLARRSASARAVAVVSGSSRVRQREMSMICWSLSGWRASTLEVDGPHERDQRVDGSCAFCGHVVSGGQQYPQSGAFTVAMARVPQLVFLQGQVASAILRASSGSDLPTPWWARAFIRGASRTW